MDGLKLDAVRETSERLQRAMDCGFEPRIIVKLMAEVMVALSNSQIAIGKSHERMGADLQAKLAQIIELCK